MMEDNDIDIVYATYSGENGLGLIQYRVDINELNKNKFNYVEIKSEHNLEFYDGEYVEVNNDGNYIYFSFMLYNEEGANSKNFMFGICYDLIFSLSDIDNKYDIIRHKVVRHRLKNNLWFVQVRNKIIFQTSKMRSNSYISKYYDFFTNSNNNEDDYRPLNDGWLKS